MKEPISGFSGSSQGVSNPDRLDHPERSVRAASVLANAVCCDRLLLCRYQPGQLSPQERNGVGTVATALTAVPLARRRMAGTHITTQDLDRSGVDHYHGIRVGVAPVPVTHQLLTCASGKHSEMTYQSIAEGRSTTEASRCFIGSILDGPGHGLIVLRGELDAAAVQRLGEHLDTFFDGPTRYLMLDARDVDCYHPDLLNLLGHTQRRLAGRRGMLQVRGLQPTRLAEPIAGPPQAAVPTQAFAPDTAVLIEGGPTGFGSSDRLGRHRRDDPTNGGQHTRRPVPHTATTEQQTPAAEIDRAPA